MSARWYDEGITPAMIVGARAYESNNPYAVDSPADLMTADDVDTAAYEMIELLADEGDEDAAGYLEEHRC